jgi:hypothetical protein
MKRRHLLLLCAALFAGGGLVSSYRDGKPLREVVALADRRRELTAGSLTPSSTKFQSAAPDAESRFGRLASALHEGSVLKRNHDLHEALNEVGVTELPGFLARAERLPGRFRDGLLAALVERWFELNPEAAAAWVRTQRDWWIFSSAWARHAPQSALAEAHAQPRKHWAEDMMKSAVATLAGTDIKAQAALLATLPEDPCRNRVLTDVAREWAVEDSAACFAFARALPPGASRTALLEIAVKAWTARDLSAAMTQLAAILPELPVGVLSSPAVLAVAEAAARKDPAAALRWAAGLPAAHYNAASAVAARIWATQDPIAALESCRADRMDTAREVIGSAMDKHAGKTLAWIESLPPGDERNRLLEGALSADSAFTSPPVSRENATRVAGLLAQLPRSAQERTAYQLGWSSGHGGKLEHVVAWLPQLKEPQLRMAAVEAAVQYRYRANPTNEAQILETFPDGPERDAALRAIALYQQEKQPAQAASKALQIADESTRRELLGDVISAWRVSEPQKAWAWLDLNPSLPREWLAEWESADP